MQIWKCFKNLAIIWEFCGLFILLLVFFFLSFVFVCVSWVVCVGLWKRRTWTTKKGGERLRGRATRRGESLAVQPFHTNNGSRGLLPFPWALDSSNSLLPSPTFFFIKIFIIIIIIYFSYFFFISVFSPVFLLVFLIPFFWHFFFFLIFSFFLFFSFF